MDQDVVAQTEPEALIRVDELWFPPDVIVIRAENKIFRVLGGILAARSTVFRDMIAFPQPANNETENIDGFPVVRLHDSAEDVTSFLRAIYDSGYWLPSVFSGSMITIVLDISCQLPPRFNCRLSWEFFDFLTSTMFPICTSALWTISPLDGMPRPTMKT
jgi:hypothetical protein